MSNVKEWLKTGIFHKLDLIKLAHLKVWFLRLLSQT